MSRKKTAPPIAGAHGAARKAIKILVVEDSAPDAEIMMRALQNDGIDAQYERVQSAAAVQAALRRQAWDAVIADFKLPGFTGMDVLGMVRSAGLDIPFIIVSGAIGEDIAVEAMRHGADDYLLKDRLSRLGAALTRALGRKRLRDEAGKAAAALRESMAGLDRAQVMAGLAHVITGPDGSFESWSETLPALIGVHSARMPKSTRAWLDIVHLDDRAKFRDMAIDAGVSHARRDIEYRVRRADGAWIDVRQVMEPLDGHKAETGARRWFNTLQDVTDQKRAAANLRASERLKGAIIEASLDCIVTIDHDGKVVEFNPAAEATFGIRRDQALEKMMVDLIIPPRLRDAHRRGFAHYLATGEGPILGKRLEMEAIRADGTEFPVEMAVTAIQAGSRPLFTGFIRDLTERRRAEHELQRFRMAMDVSVDSIYLTDPATMRFVYLNNSACQRLGYSREQLLTMGPQEVLPMDREQISHEYDKVIAAGDKGLRHERAFTRSDGSEGWTELHRRALRTEGGTLIVTIGRDITERRQADERIRRLNRIYTVLSGINALIVRVHDRDELFKDVCRIAVEAGGFRMAWVGVVDRTAMQIKPVAWHGAGLDYIQSMPLGLDAAGSAGRGLAGQAFAERKAMVSDDMTLDPRILLKKEALARGFHSLAALPLLLGEEVVGVLALYAGEIGFFDEDEMKLLHELAGDIAFALDHIDKAAKVDYLAYYDSLTGLANRTLLHERLAQFVGAASHGQHKLALVLVDIERFKTINDSLGRHAGDALLRQMADRLLATVGERSQVARIGADHFAIVLPKVKQERDLLGVIAEYRRRILEEPFQVNGNELRISTKAGIALFPRDGADADTLFRNAEAALIKAKASGEPHLFYTQQMTERSGERLTLENQLRQALEKEEFVLHYQPKLDSTSGAILGVEALIRWNSKELGLVPPMKFIPLMEETGLILEVGAWALSKAVQDHSWWLQQGLAAPRIAVNVSPIQLRKHDFVATVERALKHGALPPGIDLEITESLIMEDIQGNIAKLKQIRNLGIGIAIDDFGTGYSSLAYLAKLPVQWLKIDRSFIITMLDDSDTMTLVSTIISLAHSLRLRVVAEGVDSELQAEFLRPLGCDEMQGFLFSRPLPIEAITPLLSKAN